jgi:preprotein translocase subunit SecF
VRPLLRIVPDNTKIPFMNGRFAGVFTSAFLSIASLILFFHPGLNYTIDFRGGVLTELRFAAPVDPGAVRTAFGQLDLGEVSVQQFGSPQDALVRLGGLASAESIRPRVQEVLDKSFPGAEIRRLEVVGAKVSGDLFRDGMTAVILALSGILGWIWFRFDWQFGVGLVLTLILDTTKTIGFYVVTRLPFDLNALAAILILIGFSVTDKVVVYDRIRENLRKFKVMPLRDVIDLSINQTLSRTVATSLTVLLSILPLALIAEGSVQFMAVAIVFGIIVGTTSSIMIASPILLFLGEKRLRPGVAAAAAPAIRKEVVPH